MDSTAFDVLTRSVHGLLSRRALGRLAGAGAATAAVVAPEAAPEADARKKQRKQRAGAEHNVRGNKAIMCVNGVTTRVSKKKRKKYLKQGATRGECAAPNPTCIPTCPAGSCNIDDGCGGTCPGCPTGQVCAESVCQACTITCDVATEEPLVCGARLSEAMLGGGNLYVCPGAYQGGFNVTAPVNIYGAGSGMNETVDTILTAADAGITVLTEVPGALKLSSLRLTNGYNTDCGANLRINEAGATVTVVDCAFIDGYGESGMGICLNYGTLDVSDSLFSGAVGDYYGGGIRANHGTATITNSTFTGNRADSGGGALIAYEADANLTVRGCNFTNNESDYGGALYSYLGTMTVTDSTIIGNTAGQGGGAYLYGPGSLTLAPSVSITGNTATSASPSGGGVFVNGGTFNRNGATISGNTPDQCEGAGC